MKILNNLTLKYLKLNKKRSIVTIIGIALSAAMICAVTILTASFQSFAIEMVKLEEGNFQAQIADVGKDELEIIRKNKNIKDVMLTNDLGLGSADGIGNKEKPFIMVKQYDKNAMDKLEIKLVSGRLPENENEIVISKGTSLEEIEVSIGQRVMDGEVVPLYYGTMPNEEFIVENTKTYKIVGVIERPYFENEYGVYISGITYINENENVTVLINTKNVKNIYETMESIEKEIGVSKDISYNRNLLMFHGVSKNENALTFIYTAALVVIVVIMLGSVLVIYNAFAISVSERKKQFGMLSSIGATKKQLKKSVLFEGTILLIIGIPLGIISGIVGIGVTIGVVNNLLMQMMEGMMVDLKLVVALMPILVAIFFVILTVYISAFIPAIKASKISPIEAIRLNDDIKIKNKKLRTPKIIRKIFGVEGEIALKNLKRSKKRYRATILSLAVSILLFVSISGFVTYMLKGSDMYYQSIDYDISIYLRETDEELISKISRLQGIDRSSIIKSMINLEGMDENKLNKYIIENYEDLEMYHPKLEDGKYAVHILVCSLNKEEMDRYLNELGISELKNNEVVVVNKAEIFYPIRAEYEVLNINEGENILEDLKIAKLTDKLPFGLSDMNGNVIVITSEENVLKTMPEEFNMEPMTDVYIKSTDIDTLDKELAKLQEESSFYFTNHVKEAKQIGNMKLIIEIFLYGFIILITLIGVSNIFNTISTNIALRKKEFAMLKAMGMTNKGFNKMMNLECIFYGTKALLYSLPLSILICYIIYNSMQGVFGFGFILPVNSITISIVGVFLIVFMTMIYRKQKNKKRKYN